MASGDSVGSKTFENLKGTQETFTYECDACKLDGNIHEAKFFCYDCDEYLCNDCESCHKKVKVTRLHQIVSGDKIPHQSYSKQTPKGNTTQHKMNSLCSCNQQVDVEFYCADHDDVFCSLCKNVRHNKCYIATIGESSSAESFSGKYKTTIDKLDLLVQKALYLDKKTDEFENSLMQIEQTCEEEIKQFRIEINLLFDKLEQNAQTDLQSHLKNLSDLFKDRKETIRSTLHLLNTDKSNREESENFDDKRQIFITCNKINKSLHTYDAALEECEDMIKPTVAFERNLKLVRLQSELDCLGKVSSSSSTSEKCNILDAEVKSHMTICVKEASNSTTPWITGIAFLKNGELLIADYSNKRLVLFDYTIKSNKMAMNCSVSPWDISVIDDKEVIVTFPKERKLQYIEVSDTLKFGRVIQLKTQGHGVTVLHGFIYVSCFNCADLNVVLVLDRIGNIMQSISKTQIGFNCSLSYYVAANIKGDKLYLQNESRVTCITTCGSGIFTITDPDMKSPRGIFVDSEDNVLTCCPSSGNIYVFKSDGTGHKTLLSQSHTIIKPYSIAFRARDGTLAIGDRDNEYLHILTLT